MKTFFILCIIVGAALAAEEEGIIIGDLFEGDIILTPDQIDAVVEQDTKRGKSNEFAAMRSRHWKTNGKTDTIKYYIEDSLTSESKGMKAIQDAVDDYHRYTCIRFQRVHSKPSGPHISFFLGRGCYSYVGRISSSGQQISLGYGCWYKGTAAHEMGHALGFFHEQSRPDRDQYVEILTQNIRAGYENNFNKYKTDRIDSMGSKYDYKSLMHYGSAYFKKSDGLITIRTKNPKMQNVIGQRGGFSEGDIEQLNMMYCNGVTPSAGPVTQGPVVTNAPRTTSAPGDCVDAYPECSSWKIICDTNEFARKKCPKTCGRCNLPSTPGPVVTNAPQTNPPQTNAPPTNAPRTNQPQTNAPPTNTPRTTSSPGDCVDTYADCSSWKIICDTNEFARKKCPKTCGRCNLTSTPAPGCVDLSDQKTCDIWKNVNLCASNGYVQKQCPKTCNSC